jgi:hypothetical protein
MQPSEPRPATRAELRHGAFVAWLTFMVLLVTTVIVASMVGDMTAEGFASTLSFLPIILFYTVILGGAVSGVVTLAAVPAASRLDHALPPQLGGGGRVATFAGLGAAAGLVGAGIAALLTGIAGNDMFAVFNSPVTLIALVMTAISAAVGRAVALRRARRTSAVL